MRTVQQQIIGTLLAPLCHSGGGADQSDLRGLIKTGPCLVRVIREFLGLECTSGFDAAGHIRHERDGWSLKRAQIPGQQGEPCAQRWVERT